MSPAVACHWPALRSCRYYSPDVLIQLLVAVAGGLGGKVEEHQNRNCITDMDLSMSI